MLHYYAVEFFAPIIVTPRLSQVNDLTIYIVSDKLSTINGCSLDINFYKWNSSRIIYTKTFSNITIVRTITI